MSDKSDKDTLANVTEREKSDLNRVMRESKREQDRLTKEPSRYAAPKLGYPDKDLIVPSDPKEREEYDRTQALLIKRKSPLKQYIIDHSKPDHWLVEREHKKHWDQVEADRIKRMEAYKKQLEEKLRKQEGKK